MKKIDIVAPVECPTLSPERQLLWDAANVMQRRGKVGVAWQTRNAQGCVCTLGALFEANKAAGRMSMEEPYDEAKDRLLAHLGLKAVSGWSAENDIATVVAAMRQAALS